MKVIIRYIAVFATILALVLSSCQTRKDNLYDAFPRNENEEAGLQFMHSLSPRQLLQLCNDFGCAVDEGRESGDGFLEVIALRYYEGKKNLTFAVLMEEVENQENSLFWRRMACRFSCGREHYLSREEIPTGEAISRWGELLAAEGTPPILKKELRSAAQHLIRHSSPKEQELILPLLKNEIR